MKIYVNKRKELILKFDFERFGGIANETIQLKTSEFTKELEKEVFEAMQEIIERWQPFLDNIPTEELFAEKQKQIKQFSDYETTLTELVERGFNKIWREVKNMNYTIKYSLPYDIHRYMMQAKDEDQLATFVKMLVQEKAYGIEVVPEYV